MTQSPPRLPLRISEILPATAPPSGSGSCRRGRGRGGGAVGATTKLAPLASKINTLPPPFPLQQHVPM
jgi:hypothetical protein